MKNYCLFISTVLCSFNLQALDVTGQWRAVLDVAPEYRIVLALKITEDEQGHQIVMLSPNQSSKEMIPEQFRLEGNQLSFEDSHLKASFSGTFNEDKLIGTFTQHRPLEVSFTRLSDQDIQRLEHERQWFGDLQLSKNSTLPLVLNVAVVAAGYHVTLDSPKQQSYGIAVNKFTLSDTQLSFASSMINAHYSASWVDNQWQGTFVQGMAMPLNFAQKTD